MINEVEEEEPTGIYIWQLEREWEDGEMKRK